MVGRKYTFSMVLLVVGNLIGAGILALPIQTGGAGLFFAVAAMIVFGALMCFSALVLAREATEVRTGNFNYPSLYHRYLGRFGKWLAILANMLILYGLLTAYLAGGSAVLFGIFELSGNSLALRIVVLLLLFFILSSLSLGGAGIIARFNGWLMVILAISFAVIVVMGACYIKPERELFFNIRFLPIAVPVILTAFHFHNIIPSICRRLNWELRSVSIAIVIGILTGLVMNVIWVVVGIGVLPLTIGKYSIIYAFLHGVPATVAIAQVLDMPLFNFFAAVFALVAICTSYVANGMGLLDFNRDLLENIVGLGKNRGKYTAALLTFLPPLIIAIFFPDIFLKAIGFVGGVGIAVLFGILPTIIFFVKVRGLKLRSLAVVIFLLFLFALCSDLADDVGIINNRQAIEGITASACPVIDRDYAYNMVEEITGFGPHASGSANAGKVVKLICREADRFGFKAQVDQWQQLTVNGKITFRNVIVEVPGQHRDFVIIGSHYDSKILATVPEFAGANDSGSSTGVLLAMLKAVSELPGKPFYTLRFVFFDGEECLVNYSDNDGLFGSRHYLKQLQQKQEVSKCRAVIVLDMIGDKDLTVTLSQDSNSAMAGALLKIAEKQGWEKHFCWFSGDIYDDHVPFQQVGIPAIDIIDFNFGRNNIYWHTREDTMDKISRQSLKIVGDSALKLIWQLNSLAR